MNKKSDQPTVAKVVKEAIADVHQYLYEGNILGGKSLTLLLQEYEDRGPFNPVRGELIKHLHRCLEGMIEMEAKIVTLARTDPKWHRKIR